MSGQLILRMWRRDYLLFWSYILVSLTEFIFRGFSMISISESLWAAFFQLLLGFFNWPVSFFLLFFWRVSSELTWGFICGWIELGTSSSSDDLRTRFLTFFCGRELRTSSLSSDDSRNLFWTFFHGQTGGLNLEIGARWLKLSSDDKAMLWVFLGGMSLWRCVFSTCISAVGDWLWWFVLWLQTIIESSTVKVKE